MAIKMYDLENLPKPNTAEIERIKNLRDDQINTTDIPELNAEQLREAAAIARKKRRFMHTKKAVVAM